MYSNTSLCRLCTIETNRGDHVRASRVHHAIARACRLQGRRGGTALTHAEGARSSPASKTCLYCSSEDRRHTAHHRHRRLLRTEDCCHHRAAWPRCVRPVRCGCGDVASQRARVGLVRDTHSQFAYIVMADVGHDVYVSDNSSWVVELAQRRGLELLGLTPPCMDGSRAQKQRQDRQC